MTSSFDLLLQPFLALSLRIVVQVVLATAKVSDSPPKIVYPGTGMITFLYESDPVGKSLYRIQARGSVKAFYLVPHIRSDIDRTVSAALAITRRSGHIHLTRKVDFEAFNLTREKYWVEVLFQVIAEGNGLHPNASAWFKLTVLDVNDNPPMFAADTPHNLTIDKSTPVGKEILKVVATDMDHAESGSIFYYLDEVNGVFHINSTTGQIHLNRSLDTLDEEEFNLCIFAKDKGKPPLKTSRYLNIKILSNISEFGFPETAQPLPVHIHLQDTDPRSTSTDRITPFTSQVLHERRSKMLSTEEDTSLTASSLPPTAISSPGLKLFLISAGTAGCGALVLGLICCFFAACQRRKKSFRLPVPVSLQNNAGNKSTSTHSRYIVDCKVDDKTKGLCYINDTDMIQEKWMRLDTEKASTSMQDESYTAAAIREKTSCSRDDEAGSAEKAVLTSANLNLANTSCSTAVMSPIVEKSECQTLWQPPVKEYVQTALSADIYKRGTFTVLLPSSNQSHVSPLPRKPLKNVSIHAVSHTTIV